jgi:hypothetical protein
MKRTFLLLTLSAVLALITFNSNTSGPANNANGNKTGGPGATGTCGSCHSGASGTTGSFTIKKKSDNSIPDKYTPGEVYVVSIIWNHATINKGGFQAMVLKNAGNTQAGTIGNINGTLHTKVVTGITLLEHNQVLTKVTSSAAIATFDWTAPVKGTGNITFYGVVNAVNGDGTIGGDAVSPAFNLTLAETPNAITDIAVDNEIRIYPNPVQDQLHVSFSQTGNYTISVYSLDGKIIINRQTNYNTKQVLIPAEMAKGTYLLEVTNGQQHKTIPFMKL